MSTTASIIQNILATSGTPLAVYSGVKQKTLYYAGGQVGDLVNIEKTIDGVTWENLVTLSAANNYLYTMTEAALSLRIVGGGGLTGTCYANWIFDNGVTSVNAINANIPLASSAGMPGTVVDLGASGSTFPTQKTFAYSGGQVGDVVNLGVGNSNVGPFQSIGAIRGPASQMVASYAARYVQATYLQGGQLALLTNQASPWNLTGPLTLVLGGVSVSLTSPSSESQAQLVADINASLSSSGRPDIIAVAAASGAVAIGSTTGTAFTVTGTGLTVLGLTTGTYSNTIATLTVGAGDNVLSAGGGGTATSLSAGSSGYVPFTSANAAIWGFQETDTVPVDTAAKTFQVIAPSGGNASAVGGGTGGGYSWSTGGGGAGTASFAAGPGGPYQIQGGTGGADVGGGAGAGGSIQEVAGMGGLGGTASTGGTGGSWTGQGGAGGGGSATHAGGSGGAWTGQAGAGGNGTTAQAAGAGGTWTGGGGNAGVATTGGGAGGGNATLSGGAGSGNGNGGQANLNGGSASGTGTGGGAVVGGGNAVGGNGGTASVLGGSTTTGTGGTASVTGGSGGSSSGNGGAASVTGGGTTGTGNGGAASLVGGAATTGIGGAVSVTGGAATSGTAGGVNIDAGAAGGGGTKALVQIGTTNASGILAGLSGNKFSNRGATTAALAVNYIASETGANNAIAGALTDAGGTAVPTVAGLRVVVLLGHSLQAGANTFALNGGSAVAIKSHLNPANNLASAYVSGGIVDLMYESTGPAWLDMSQ